MYYTQKRQLQTLGDWIDYYQGEMTEGRMTEAVATSEFSTFLLRGLKVAMTDGHNLAPRVWERVANVVRTDDEFVRFAGIGKPTGVDVVEEEEYYPKGRITHDRTTVTTKKYGYVMEYTKEMLRGDKSGAIARTASGMGEDHQKKKDAEWAADSFNNGSTRVIYDGSNLYANNHPNVTGSGANALNDNNLALGALSQANLEAARQTIAGWNDYDGDHLDVTVSDLICAPNVFDDAVRLTASTAYAVVDFSSGVQNPVRGIANPVQWTRLAAGTYYFTTGVPGAVHLEQWPLSMERHGSDSGDAFWRDIAQAVKTSEKWGSGIVDWRGLAKGN